MYQCDTLCRYGLWRWWYIHWIEAIKELCNVVCTYVALYSYGLQKWGYQRTMDLAILVSVILNHIQIFEWIVETYTRLTLLFWSVKNNPTTPQINQVQCRCSEVIHKKTQTCYIMSDLYPKRSEKAPQIWGELSPKFHSLGWNICHSPISYCWWKKSGTSW